MRWNTRDITILLISDQYVSVTYRTKADKLYYLASNKPEDAYEMLTPLQRTIEQILFESTHIRPQRYLTPWLLLAFYDYNAGTTTKYYISLYLKPPKIDSTPP